VKDDLPYLAHIREAAERIVLFGQDGRVSPNLGRNSDGRLPFLSQLDVYLQHQFRLGSRVRLTLTANAINALDLGAATNYGQSELFSGQAISVPETEFYQGINTQALIAQQGLERDARFLMDSGYQAPRTFGWGSSWASEAALAGAQRPSLCRSSRIASSSATASRSFGRPAARFTWISLSSPRQRQGIPNNVSSKLCGRSAS